MRQTIAIAFFILFVAIDGRADAVKWAAAAAIAAAGSNKNFAGFVDEARALLKDRNPK